MARPRLGLKESSHGGMADAVDLKSTVRKDVPVRVRLRAPMLSSNSHRSDAHCLADRAASGNPALNFVGFDGEGATSFPAASVSGEQFLEGQPLP